MVEGETTDAEGEHPRVSVVVPTNRSGRFLDAALASVAGQTFGAWEIIVAANSTADVHLLKRITDRYPRTRLVYQPTTGPVLSRNLGTALARGEYVAFLDDDDVWHPDRLRLQVAQLDRHPEAIFCYCAATTIDHLGNTVDTAWLPTDKAPEDLLRGRVDIPRIVTLLFRRAELIRIGGFHPSFRYAEDDELILRALQFGTITSVPQALVGYRRHDGNVTSESVFRRRQSSGRVIRLQRWGAEAWEDPQWAARMAENEERFQRRTALAEAADAVRSLRRGEIRAGAWLLTQAVRHSPRDTVEGVTTVLREGVRGRLRDPHRGESPTPEPTTARRVTQVRSVAGSG